MQVTTVYKTDKSHSYESRKLIGVCTTKRKMLSLCSRFAKMESTCLTRAQVIKLSTTYKTEGYKGEGEFFCENVITDRFI